MFTYNSLVIVVLTTKSVLTPAKLMNKITAHTFQGVLIEYRHFENDLGCTALVEAQYRNWICIYH